MSLICEGKKGELMKKVFALIMCAILSFTLFGCSSKENELLQNERFTTVAQQQGIIETGFGGQKFSFTVTHRDGTIKKYLVHTDKETVGEALYALKLIDGEKEEYGLYVKTVDGEALDYNADGAFWSLYIDGKISSQGVDFVKLTDGTSFEFRAVNAG